MKSASALKQAFPNLNFSEQVPLSRVTTFQLGGPCPLLIDNPPADQLPALIQEINKQQIPFFVIGQGSNLVVSDAGLDRAVVRFCSEIPDVSAESDQVTVSGATLLDDFSRITVEKNLGDLTYCSGIPGTVGGGIAGNAGAFGRQIGDHLIAAKIAGFDGTVRTVTRDELEFSYRHSRLKETGEIILSALFELPPENKEVMQRERERIMRFRQEHHPNWHEMPCAGSVFKNVEPTSAVDRRQAAGHFLEEAGAKQLSVGGATVFEKHANMIVGGNRCTAQNVYDLCELMKQVVHRKTGIELVQEIRFLGDFTK